ncbi:MAG: PEGA domain-containing protein [Deltaproteobacteria bacterium]
MLVRIATIVVVAGNVSLESPAARTVAEAATDRVDLDVVTPEELFVVDRKLRDNVLACGSDLECTLRTLRLVDAQLVLLTIVDAEHESPLVGLRLIDMKRATVNADDAFEMSSTDGLLDELTSRVGRLLDAAGHRRYGRATIATVPAEATVFVEDRAVDSPEDLRLAPGSYALRVAADGHRAKQRVIVVESGEHQRLNVELEPNPWYTWPSVWIGAGAVVAVSAMVIVGVVVANGGESQCTCLVYNGDGSACAVCK